MLLLCLLLLLSSFFFFFILFCFQINAKIYYRLFLDCYLLLHSPFPCLYYIIIDYSFGARGFSYFWSVCFYGSVFVCHSFRTSGSRFNRLLSVFKSHKPLEWTYLERILIAYHIISYHIVSYHNMCGFDAWTDIRAYHRYHYHHMHSDVCKLKILFDFKVCSIHIRQSIVCCSIYSHSWCIQQHNARSRSGDEFLSSRHFERQVSNHTKWYIHHTAQHNTTQHTSLKCKICSRQCFFGKWHFFFFIGFLYANEMPNWISLCDQIEGAARIALRWETEKETNSEISTKATNNDRQPFQSPSHTHTHINDAFIASHFDLISPESWIFCLSLLFGVWNVHFHLSFSNVRSLDVYFIRKTFHVRHIQCYEMCILPS